jgi:hypothetical protein
MHRDDLPDRASGADVAILSAEAVTHRLRALGVELAATPDEEFRRATRARLVAMAAVRSPCGDQVRRPVAHRSPLRRLLAGAAASGARGRPRLAARAAGAALVAASLGGVLAISQEAGPGDALYDVKLGSEQTRLALAGDATRGPTLLGFAHTRLTELGELTGQRTTALPSTGATAGAGRTAPVAALDPALVLATLATMDEQTTQGTWWLTTDAVESRDSAPLDELTEWAATQSAALSGLDTVLPAAVQDALSESEGLLAEVAQRGTQLRRALGCSGGPATAGADQLGPVAAPCPPVVEPGDGSGTPSSASGTGTGTPTDGTPSTEAGGPVTDGGAVPSDGGDGTLPGGPDPRTTPRSPTAESAGPGTPTGGKTEPGGTPLPSTPPTTPPPTTAPPSEPSPTRPSPSEPSPSEPSPSEPSPSEPPSTPGDSAPTSPATPPTTAPATSMPPSASAPEPVGSGAPGTPGA